MAPSRKTPRRHHPERPRRPADTVISREPSRCAGQLTRDSSQRLKSAAGDSFHVRDVFALADRLHSAAIHLLRRVRQRDAATGEGPARLSALSVLVFGGPKTLSELAAAEQVKPPTMSRIVAGLAASRLVEALADPEDGRRLQIRATPIGTRLLEKARQRRVAALAAHLDALAPDEIAQLDAAVEVLRGMLQSW